MKSCGMIILWYLVVWLFSLWYLVVWLFSFMKSCKLIWQRNDSELVTLQMSHMLDHDNPNKQKVYKTNHLAPHNASHNLRRHKSIHHICPLNLGNHRFIHHVSLPELMCHWPIHHGFPHGLEIHRLSYMFHLDLNSHSAKTK